MTPTERLRELLDERGMEYETEDRQTIRYTEWGDWVFSEPLYAKPHTLGAQCELMCIPATPEQAIAATLGAGTCHIKPWKMERYTGFYDCMECECGYVSDVSDWAKWHFCPNCGRRTVDE